MQGTELKELIARAKAEQWINLDLSGNQIAEIPATIGQLTSLKRLSFSGNQIAEIPEAIGQLTSLKRLNFSRNQITKIPAIIGQLTSLESLDLSRNQIAEIPAMMENLIHLKRLVLQGNPISKISAAVIRQGWGEGYWDDGNPQAIFDYLKEQRAGERPLQEAKMIGRI